jgi:Tol biopolymer transport system component
LAFINSEDPSQNTNLGLNIFDSDRQEITTVHTYTMGSLGPVVAPLLKWSPDGHWIAYTPNDIDASLWIIHTEDGRAYEIDRKPFGYLKESLVWAADSETLYYLKFEDQERNSVWATDPQGAHKQQLPVAAGEIVGLLPQQANVVAITSKSGDPLQLNIVSFDNKQQRQVFAAPGKEWFNQLMASPDEEWIVLETISENTGSNYWLVNLNDPKHTRLLASAAEATDTQLWPISWTPDGKYLVEYMRRIDRATASSEYYLVFEDMLTGQKADQYKLPFDAYFPEAPYLSIGWRELP